MRHLNWYLFLMIVGCASTSLMNKINLGDSPEAVVSILGQPNKRTPATRYDEMYFYSLSQDENYTVIFKEGKVVIKGDSAEVDGHLTAEFLNMTPHELCSYPKKLKRYESKEECKEDVIREQQQITQRIEQRKQLAIQYIMNQPAIPAYQPQYMTPPAPVQMWQPPKTTNCHSVPDGFGGVRTQCQ